MRSVVKVMSVAVIAVLVSGQALNALCESFCPAHTRQQAAHHATTPALVHDHHATDHAASPKSDDDDGTAARLDSPPSSCCDAGAATRATLTTTGATTRHNLALACAHRVPKSPARLHPSSNVGVAAPLERSSRAPVPLTLRI
jgi:hypothetical protein